MKRSVKWRGENIWRQSWRRRGGEAKIKYRRNENGEAAAKAAANGVAAAENKRRENRRGVAASRRRRRKHGREENHLWRLNEIVKGGVREI